MARCFLSPKDQLYENDNALEQLRDTEGRLINKRILKKSESFRRNSAFFETSVFEHGALSSIGTRKLILRGAFEVQKANASSSSKLLVTDAMPRDIELETPMEQLAASLTEEEKESSKTVQQPSMESSFTKVQALLPVTTKTSLESVPNRNSIDEARKRLEQAVIECLASRIARYHLPSSMKH